MYYKIRSESIHLVFTIGGTISVAASGVLGEGALPPPGGVPLSGSIGFGYISGNIVHQLVSAGWVYDVRKVFYDTAYEQTTRHLELSCFGNSNSYDDTISSLDGNVSGTLVVDINVDVCLTTTYPQTGTGDLAPFFQRIEDTPPNTRVHLYRIPQPNQDVVATLTIGSRTLTVTGNTGSSPAPLEHSTDLSMSCNAGGSISSMESGAASGSASGSITMAGWPTSSFGGKSCSTSTSAASSSSSTGSGQVSVSGAGSVMVAILDEVSASGEAEANRTESGDRTAVLEAAVFHMIYNPSGSPGMYSDSLVALLTGFTNPTKLFTGSFQETITQKQCNQSVSGVSAEVLLTGGDTDTCSDGNSIDTYTPTLAATIQTDSLTTNGDDPQATRLMMRGKSWAAMTLAQATETIIDGCSTLTISSGDYAGAWSISGSGSLSIASSAYVQFSGAGETLTRAFAPKGYFAGYRWLMIRCRADATSKQLTVNINGKTWTITTHATANTWKDCYIDLCLPTNGTVDVDGFNTRWPEDSDGYPSEGTAYYGVGASSGIDITGMESGVVYQIDKLALNMGDISAYGVNSPSYGYTDTDCVSSFGPWVNEKPDQVVSEVGTTTKFYLKRFLHALPEEVGQSIEEAAFKKQVTVGGFTGVTTVTYTHPSILDIITRLNNRRYPGVTAVDARPMPTPSGDLHPPASHEYYNSDQYGVYLGGGGVIAIQAPSGNIDPNNWFRLATNMDHVGLWVSDTWTETELNLNAQPLYDSVGDWFSGCGDVFEHRNLGATDTGALLLRAASIIRGYARGIVADTSFVPLDAAVVDLMQAGVNRGSGTSETDTGGQGEYFTLLPFPHAPVASTLKQDTHELAFSAHTRLRQRGVFVGITVTADEKICYYMTSDQKHYLYYIGTTSGTTGTNLCLKRVYQTTNGELGASPSIGTLKTTQIAAGNFSYPSAVELSGNYPASDIREGRHGSGATHGVVVINKATSQALIYLSTDYAEDWRMETIGGTYSVASATEHNGRVVFMGWRSNNWYVRIGAPRAYTGVSGSGDYEWSSEVLVVATTKKSGRLWVREDGTIHFTYLNSSEVPTIISCSSLANDGTGTWN